MDVRYPSTLQGHAGTGRVDWGWVWDLFVPVGGKRCDCRGIQEKQPPCTAVLVLNVGTQQQVVDNSSAGDTEEQYLPCPVAV